MINDPNLAFYILLGIAGLAALLSAWVFYKSRANRLAKFDQEFFQIRWQGVEILSENAPPQAVLEADKLFDHALKGLGYEGNFVDKYKNAQKLNRNSQAIWDAHKLRNRIAHEADFTPSTSEVRRALQAFAHGLGDFGISLD